MSKDRSTRHRRLRLKLFDRLVVPVERFFGRLPALEYGHLDPTVTRLQCEHPALAGRRAVHISDLHIHEFHPRHQRIAEQIAGLEPDWIFVTGDLLSHAAALPHVFRFLGRLRQTAPVYLTLGNHDHHSGVPVERFMESADVHKVHLLINQATFVPLASGELGIIGVDDPVTHRADVRCIPSARSGRFSILLAHAANILESLDDSHHIDLVLFGHSHGGQWTFPKIRPFWLPYGCYGLTHGHHHHKRHRIYVNRGLGWSILPIRLNCPPELVVIEWIG